MTSDCKKHKPSPWTGVKRRYCSYSYGRTDPDFCKDCYIKFIEKMAAPATLSKELYYRLGKR